MVSVKRNVCFYFMLLLVAFVFDWDKEYLFLCYVVGNNVAFVIDLRRNVYFMLCC